MDLKEIRWRRRLNYVAQDRKIVYSVVNMRAMRFWHGGVVGDSTLLRGHLRPFTIKVLCYFEMSGIYYPVTRHRGQAELSPRVI
jgi:hypothetical protein